MKEDNQQIAKPHVAFGLLDVPLFVRGLGVLFAISFFFSATAWPWPEDIFGYIVPALLLVLCVIICVPFSKIRSARTFWALVSIYASCLLGFIAFHAWLGFQELEKPWFPLSLFVTAAGVMLLVAQLACILYSRTFKKRVEQSINQLA